MRVITPHLSPLPQRERKPKSKMIDTVLASHASTRAYLGQPEEFGRFGAYGKLYPTPLPCYNRLLSSVDRVA